MSAARPHWIILLAFFFTISLRTIDASTYHVAKTGDDSNTCAQATSVSSARLTIRSGITCLKPGDTLYVQSGVYGEEIVNPTGGTSWGNPVTIAAYPGHTVTIKPNSGASRVLTFASGSSQYVIVDGFILDASNAGYDVVKITHSTGLGHSNYIRIKNSEIKNARNQGILVFGTGNEFIGLNIHHNGVDRFTHGMYICGYGNLVEKSEIHENSGYGITVYNETGGADNNTLRANKLWGNGWSSDYTAGIGLASGSGNKVYNNLVWNNKQGVQINYGASNSEVHNNTIYNNIGVEGYGIYVGSGSTNAAIKNNIAYKNQFAIGNLGSASTLANNLTTDPLFMGAASGNFRLQSTSTAIDAGTSAVNTIVTIDFDGTPRPKGTSFDIGAYEFGSSTTSSSTAVTVDSTYAGYSTNPVDDGVVNAAGGIASTWASESSTSPHWIEINLPSPVQMNFAKIWWGQNTSQQKYMTSQRIDVQYWDGANFQALGTIQPTTFDVPSSTITFSSVTTSKLKFYQPANLGAPTYSSVLWITEVDYGLDTATSNPLAAPTNVSVK
jgi:hypothetical protein